MELTAPGLASLLLAGAPCLAQTPARAALDGSTRVTLGTDHPIESRFADLPLVEPHLAAHPEDARHLLVAAMVVTDVRRPYESCRLSTFVSTDGGVAWREEAHDWWGYDPWTAILPGGRTAMTWLGTEGSFQGRFPVRYFASSDGGATWDLEVQTSAGSHDGTKLSGSGDTFYFTTVRFGDEGGLGTSGPRLGAVWPASRSDAFCSLSSSSA